MITKSIPKEYQTNSLILNTELVSSMRMESDDKARTVRFPQWIWDEIDREAISCRRSSVKQMEEIFAAYYRGNASQLNLEQLETIKSQQQDKGSNMAYRQTESAPIGEIKDERRKRKTG